MWGTYRKLLEDVDEDFVCLSLLRVELLDWFLNRSGSNGARLEELGSPGRAGLLCLRLGRDQHGLVDDELADVLCGDQLCMTVVDHLVDDLVDEHEVLADALLVEHAAVVAEDLHHPVDDVHDGAGSSIGLARCYEVDAKLLREEVVDAVDVLSTRATN